MASSEYTKPRTTISQLLPNVLRSDISENLSLNTFDRFLTKEETNFIGGAIGVKRRQPKSIRIPEDSPHAAAWQLQPAMYNKVATEERVHVFKDILTKLEFDGIDANRLATWGATEEFNFAPPINPDKLTNFADYFWVDTDGTSKPQYITIANPATVVRARINSKTRELDQLLTQPTANAVAIQHLQLELDSLQVELEAATSFDLGWDEGLFDDGGVWDTADGWKTINVEPPTGLKYWDSSSAARNVAQRQWMVSNKWVHKNDVTPGSYAVRAELPIIEYDNRLELNEWTFTKHRWAYRKTPSHSWTEIPGGPTNDELLARYPILDVDYGTTPGHGIFVVDGNVTTLFVPGFKFSVEMATLISGSWETFQSTYDSDNQVTRIEVTREPIISSDGCSVFGAPSFEFKTFDGGPDCGTIVPLVTTSMGDPWLSFFDQWLWLGTETAVPVNHQQENVYVTAYEAPAVQDQVEFILPDGITFDFGAGNIRVYVNGVRQYYQYHENRPIHGRLSTGITFFSGLDLGDTVRVETTPAALSDVGKTHIQVRTVASDVPIDEATEYVSLVEFRKNEQVKTELHQYPLFDLFWYTGQTAYAANSLFVFQESKTAAVEPNTQLRIVTADSGKNVFFEQLFTAPTSQLYFYHVVDDLQGTWFDTVWKKGSLEQYVPRYVNEYREANGDQYLDENSNVQTVNLPVGDPAGDWEVVNPFYYNLTHELRDIISYRELYSHFGTIVSKQQIQGYTPTYPGVVDTFDYGVGGTIKLHNDNMDLLVSATTQDTVSVADLLNWASNQYTQQLSFIDSTFEDELKNLLHSDDVNSLVNLSSFVSNAIIDLFQQREHSVIFGDTSAYDGSHGIQQWVATAPMLGLVPVVQPVVAGTTIKHHDGHISDFPFGTKSYENIVQSIHVDITGTVNPADLTTGCIWKDSANTLHKFMAVVSTDLPHNRVAGLVWFNPTDMSVHVASDNTWEVTSLTYNDLWTIIDVRALWSSTVMDVEQRLYEVTVHNGASSRFPDYSEFITSNDDVSLFFALSEDAFLGFCRERGLAPYAPTYVAQDATTWNYNQLLMWHIEHATLPNDLAFNMPYPLTVDDFKNMGTSQAAVYEYFYGTAHPEMEPWKLQGFATRPDWWTSVYGDFGTWTSSMWSNIQHGVCPFPVNHTIRSYDKIVGINTYDTQIDGILPGQQIPLYYSGDSRLVDLAFIPASPANTTIVLSVIKTDNFSFGDGGPSEFTWKQSVAGIHDVQTVLYQLQPMRYVSTTFDEILVEVNGLQISSRTGNVRNHREIVFHGALLNNNLYTSRGLNQWFVHYNRMYGFDLETSDFAPSWTNWQVKLAYLTGSMIDTESLTTSTEYFPVTNQDVSVFLKRTKGVKRFDLTTLNVVTSKRGTTSARGSQVIPFGTGDDWEFTISGLSPIKRISVCSAKRVNLISMDPVTNELVLQSQHEWNNGDEIRLSYGGDYVCRSLIRDYPYYVINTSDPQRIKLSESYTGAVEQLNSPIYDSVRVIYSFDPSTTEFDDLDIRIDDLDDTGIHVFQYNSADDTWVRHSNGAELFKLPLGAKYALANSGTQLVAGTDYAELSNNWVQLLHPISTYDSLDIRVFPNVANGDVVEKQVAFRALGGAHTSVAWEHVALSANELMYGLPHKVVGVQNLIDFIDGYAESCRRKGFEFSDYSSTEVDVETGNLVSWNQEVEKLIDDIYTTGLTRTYRAVNPFKHNLRLTSDGMVTNVLAGPYTKQVPCIYDQYGNPFIDSHNLKVFRADGVTHLSCPPPLTDTVEAMLAEPYMSAVRLYIDSFQHALLFRQYTADNYLLYDPFVGMNIGKIRVSFNKQQQKTQRPNLGGYFLSENKLSQNIEASIENIRKYYDTNTVNETADFLKHARELLGYRDPSYLDSLDIGNKSKFLFWKGMIQNKGASNSIDPIVNSRQFKSAFIDEYFAYQVANFGHADAPKYPRINLQIEDTVNDTLKFEFLQLGKLPTSEFTTISQQDSSRWYEGSNREFLSANLRFGTKTLFAESVIPSTEGYVELSTVAPNYTVLASNSASVSVTTIITQSTTIAITPAYIPGVGMLSVSTPAGNIPFQESADGLSITVDVSYVGSAPISIRRSVATLIEGTHYSVVGDRCLHFASTFDTSVWSLEVYGTGPNFQQHNPLKVIDRISRTVPCELNIFDPVLGRSNDRVAKYITYTEATDPAAYNTGVEVSPNTRSNVWGSQEVNRTWLRSTAESYGYVPYYNKSVYTSDRQQIAAWGKLASWSTPTLYEWTETSEHPFDMLQRHELDSSVEYPYASYYFKVRNDVNSEWSEWISMEPQHVFVRGFDQAVVSGSIDISSLAIDMSDNTVHMAVFRNEIQLPVGAYTYTLEPGSDSKIVSIHLDDFAEYETARIIKTYEYPSTDLIEQTTTSPDLIQYHVELPHVEVPTLDPQGNTQSITHFYWVAGKNDISSTRDRSLLSIVSEWVYPSTPFYAILGYDGVGFTRMFAKNIRSVVNEDARYDLQITMDTTFRDVRNVQSRSLPMDIHREWVMIREHQSYNVPRSLWDKVTETMIGYSLSDNSQLIPSLDRVLVDAQQGTTTRYGIGATQAISEQNEVINIIIQEINNPAVDMSPINREAFLSRYTFDTPDDIISTMNRIYLTFPSEHVNRLFFAVLRSALAKDAEFEGIYKTSMVALYGVRIIETTGRVIDD